MTKQKRDSSGKFVKASEPEVENPDCKPATIGMVKRAVRDLAHNGNYNYYYNGDMKGSDCGGDAYAIGIFASGFLWLVAMLGGKEPISAWVSGVAFLLLIVVWWEQDQIRAPEIKAIKYDLPDKYQKYEPPKKEKC